MEVIAAWGFNYRTCAVWDKSSNGPGYYFRQSMSFFWSRPSATRQPPDERAAAVDYPSEAPPP